MGRKKGVVLDEGAPDDFDPENPYKDPVAMLEMREHLVREKWIDIETAKIIREKLKWCYRIEGVNHLQKCRHLVQQYLDSTRGIGWGKDHRPPSLHAISAVCLCLLTVGVSVTGLTAIEYALGNIIVNPEVTSIPFQESVTTLRTRVQASSLEALKTKAISMRSKEIIPFESIPIAADSIT
ncbi:hypothetical protein TEA_029903 [Camellia sinensis var. sinensis]|uniref:NADH dehydrogenase [ubiquinone] 1 beta subcomplex subunit 10-B n=1 Tax=Camellia sinensis var. sinensis TaxID=542762 RepID=A0A4S4CWW1_CAMSN|nr:hypothetical protein TEA_029903 [Camellia sinensis var. sinensis]